MSDSGGEEEEPKRDLGEVKEEVQQKLLESFQAFDNEGTGSISNNEVKLVIEMMGMKMDDKEIYKIIADIDPSNTGFVQYSDF